MLLNSHSLPGCRCGCYRKSLALTWLLGHFVERLAGDYKCNRIERRIHHYGSPFNAVPLLDWYRNSPTPETATDFRNLRIGWAIKRHCPTLESMAVKKCAFQEGICFGDSSLITLLYISPSANLVYYSRTIV